LNPQIVARAIVIARAITFAERPLMDHVLVLQEEVLAAVDRGEQTVSVMLDAAAWLAIIDEVKDRRPRNLSQLLRDDFIDRLEAVVMRLENGPAEV
jgi:hypothetical protein